MNICLPPTATRVSSNTKASANERIRERTKTNIAEFLGAEGNEIVQRIQELEKEWDTERVLEVNFSLIVLGSTFLGFMHNRKWFALGGIAAGFLLQHALQGWCPPLPLIRHLGVRTAEEINEEKNILKLNRGDYDGLYQK